MVFLIHLVFLLEGHMTDFVILLVEFLHHFLHVAFCFSSDDLEFLYHFLFLSQVGFLLATCSGIGGIACIEELVACSLEISPQLFAHFLGHHAYGLPFLLKRHEFVARRFPVSTVLQGLSFFHEGLLAGSIVSKLLLELLEVFALTAEEVVASSAEALEYLDVHLLRSKAYGLPLSLDVNDFFCAFLPVGRIGIGLCSHSLGFLTEGSLAGKIFLFLTSQFLEVLLMALVNNSGSSLETVPDVLAELLGHRSHFAILLMQFLQLVEGADDVFLVGKFFGSLAEFGFEFKVLLEVVLACLAVELQQVVELLHVELVVAPEFACPFCRHGTGLFPFLLELLEFVV